MSFFGTYINAMTTTSLYVIVKTKNLLKDDQLRATLDLLRSVAGLNPELELEFDSQAEQQLKQLRMSMRPLIGLIRLSMAISVPSSLFALLFGSLTYQTIGSLSLVNAVIITVWSVVLTLLLMRMIWCQSAAIVTIAVVCKYINIQRSSLEQIQVTDQQEDSFTDYLTEHLNVVQEIRKFNETLKLLFGSLMTYYFVDVTFCIFVLIQSMSSGFGFKDYPLILLGSAELSIFILLILVASNVTDSFRKQLIQLYRRCDQTCCSAIKRFKFESIIKGMEFNNSFDCFSCIPNIDYMFIYVVSLDIGLDTGHSFILTFLVNR